MGFRGFATLIVLALSLAACLSTAQVLILRQPLSQPSAGPPQTPEMTVSAAYLIVRAGQSAPPIAISATDLDTPLTRLTLRAESSNPQVVGPGGLQLTRTPTGWTLSVTLQPTASGSTEIQLELDDEINRVRSTVTVATLDDLPDAPALVNLTDVAPGANVASQPVVPVGFNTPVALTATGGELLIGADPVGAPPSAWVPAGLSATLSPGQSLAVRMTAPSVERATGTVRVAVAATTGSTPDWLWTVQSGSGTPDDFQGITGAAPNDRVVSQPYLLSGVTIATRVTLVAPAALSAQILRNGDPLSAPDGAWSSGPQDLAPGDRVAFRLTTGPLGETDHVLTLRFPQGTERTWTVRTGDLRPDLSIPGEPNATAGALVVSAAATPTSFDLAVPVTVPAGQPGNPEVQIEGGPWGLSGLIRPQQALRLRAVAGAADGSTRTVRVRVGETEASWALIARDTVPDAFAFPDTTGHPLEDWAVSGEVEMRGLEGQALAVATGGELSINGGPWTTLGQIGLGGKLRLRQLIGSAPLTPQSMSVTVGGVAATWRATSLGNDTVPAAFTVPDLAGQEPMTTVQSAVVTLTDFDAPVPVELTAPDGTPEISIENGAWAASPAGQVTLRPNQPIQLRVTTGAHLSTVNVTLRVGGVSDTWTVAVRAADPVPNAFALPDLVGQPARTLVESTVTPTGYLDPAPVELLAGSDATALVSIGGGPFAVPTGATRINPGQSLTVRLNTGTADGGARTATVRLGGAGGPQEVFSATTVDQLPDNFAVANRTFNYYGYHQTVGVYAITGVNTSVQAVLDSANSEVAFGLIDSADQHRGTVFGNVGPFVPNGWKIQIYDLSPRQGATSPAATSLVRNLRIGERTITYTTTFRAFSEAPVGVTAPDGVAGATVGTQVTSGWYSANFFYDSQPIIAVASNGQAVELNIEGSSTWVNTGTATIATTTARITPEPGNAYRRRFRVRTNAVAGTVNVTATVGATPGIPSPLIAPQSAVWSLTSAARDPVPDLPAPTAVTVALPNGFNLWTHMGSFTLTGTNTAVVVRVVPLDGGYALLRKGTTGDLKVEESISPGELYQVYDWMYAPPAGHPARAYGRTYHYRLDFIDPNTSGVVASSGAFSVTVPAAQATPAAFSFAPRTGAGGNVTIDSDPVTLGGANFVSPAPVTLGAGSHASAQVSINGGAYITPAADTRIAPGQSLRLRLTTGPADGSSRSATVTVGGVSATWTVTTADLTPDPLAFTDLPSQPVNAWVPSNIVTVAGVGPNTPFAVAGPGTPAVEVVGSGTRVAAGTVSPGQQLRLWVFPTQHATTLPIDVTVGSATTRWSVTTRAADTVPDAFNLPPRTDQPAATRVTSDLVRPAGFLDEAVVTLTDDGHGTAEMSLNGGPWTRAEGRLFPGQSLRLRLTTGAADGGTRTATVTVGGVASQWRVTTGDSLPDPFVIAPKTGAPGATIVSDPVTPVGFTGTVPASVSGLGALLSIAGGGLTTNASLTAGQSFTVQLPAPTSGSTATATVSVGGRSAEFRVTGTP